MSWFDTSKLASIANKAMKEAQKTLDGALEITEESENKREEANDKQASVWNSWKKISTTSSDPPSSKLSENCVDNNLPSSTWGNFTGSFFEAGTVGDSHPAVISSEPVSKQPSKTVLQDEGSEAMPVPEISSSMSSVLSGEEEERLTNSWEEEDKFTRSKLVVSERAISSSPDNLDLARNIVDDDNKHDEEISSSNESPEMQSVDLSTSQVSSISVISPSSIEAIGSPSDLEIVSPEEEIRPNLVTLVSLTETEDMDSSVSSDRTLVVQVEDVQDMLTEAIMEEKKKEVESSATSSSHSSDIVKVESVSELTSCDEGCNYSTSSDIEVLNSPQQGRGAGHMRNLSDQSISEEGETVTELRRKNQELNQLVAAREGRLLAVSREITQLQEESGEMSMRLQNSLDQARAEKIVSGELKNTVKRLEGEIFSTVGQRENLEKEVARLNKSLKDVGGDEEEKDQIINDLRCEGEALARQNGKQAELLRKLRVKEKTFDTELEKWKSEALQGQADSERLSKSISAKNEVEGSQSEAIKSLTEVNKAWETENLQLKSDLEDNIEKVTGLRSSLETAYREMTEMKRKLEEAAGEAAAAALSKEVASKQEAVLKLEEERHDWTFQRAGMESQLRNLQDTLKLQEQASREREEMYRLEVATMRTRVEHSETRHEDLAENVGQATKPLLRQIETLQASLKQSVVNQEQVEQSLTVRLEQATTSLARAQEKERSAGEQYRTVSSKMARLESNIEQEKLEKEQAESKVNEMEEQKLRLDEKVRDLEKDVELVKKTSSKDLTELKREKDFLSTSLEAERLDTDSQKRKGLILMEQLQERDRRVSELQTEMEVRLNTSKDDCRGSIHSSPTPSLSQVSMTESLMSRDPWPEEVFMSNSTTRVPSLYESVGRLNTTSMLENLQSQLKLKEGEIYQLQAEKNNFEREKGDMTTELTRLTIQEEKMANLDDELTKLKAEYTTLQQKYQTILTMYGEKVEEAQELRLDLEEVKEMYKMQIDQLTGQNKP